MTTEKLQKALEEHSKALSQLAIYGSVSMDRIDELMDAVDALDKQELEMYAITYPEGLEDLVPASWYRLNYQRGY
jgi:hypothetical protein